MSATLSSVQKISASDDGAVWAVTASQQVYRLSPGAEEWEQMPGALVDIAAVSASEAWGINASQQAMRFDASRKTWQFVTGGLTHIAARGSDVWGLLNSSIYRYPGRDGVTWQSIEGELADLSVGSATSIWGVGPDHKVWKYVGGSKVWLQVAGDLVQISAAGDDVWGVDANGQAWQLDGNQGWQLMADTIKVISLGSTSGVWAIDSAGQAVCLASPQASQATGDEQWLPTLSKRWTTTADDDAKYDPTKSTHLWEVCRAAEVARAEPEVGPLIYNLVRPGALKGQSPFHDALCQGLWDADEADPYRNSVVEGDHWYGTLSATYKSHFYDPDSGENWEGESSPTAKTEAPKFFQQALTFYKNGDMRAAGYALGLSLHYLTDVTQPMHASNYTFLSSTPFGYHSAFEDLAISVMKGVKIAKPYENSSLPANPADYVVAAARTSRPRSATICSDAMLKAWNRWRDFGGHGWPDEVTPEITGSLQDGVAITAQYLVLWMRAAGDVAPLVGPGVFSQAYAASGGVYWGVDRDGHLYRRQPPGRWERIPVSTPVVSFCTASDGHVYVVGPNSILSYEAPGWREVYPPPLSDNIPWLAVAHLVAVAPAVFWALDIYGKAWLGQGLLPEVEWRDTGGPTLTSLAAISADTAWGANSADGTGWEFANNTWQARGRGVAQVSIDDQGTPWGLAPDGSVVTYADANWGTPPAFSTWSSDPPGLRPPDWGPLAWISARGGMVVVDQQGVAWAPSPLFAPGSDAFIPLA